MKWLSTMNLILSVEMHTPLVCILSFIHWWHICGLFSPKMLRRVCCGSFRSEWSLRCFVYSFHYDYSVVCICVCGEEKFLLQTMLNLEFVPAFGIYPFFWNYFGIYPFLYLCSLCTEAKQNKIDIRLRLFNWSTNSIKKHHCLWCGNQIPFSPPLTGNFHSNRIRLAKWNWTGWTWFKPINHS